MLSIYRRHGVVVALVVLVGLAGLAVQADGQIAPLPAVGSLTVGTGWRVVSTDRPTSFTGEVYQDWTLIDGQGTVAYLFLGSASVQKMVHWSGELGYLGAGYQIKSLTRQSVRLASGRSAPISAVTVQHLNDTEYVVYATVSPDAIVARGTDDLIRTGWNVVRGGGGPYYLVRISIPQYNLRSQGARNRAATRLLAHVLSILNTDAHAL